MRDNHSYLSWKAVIVNSSHTAMTLLTGPSLLHSQSSLDRLSHTASHLTRDGYKYKPYTNVKSTLEPSQQQHYPMLTRLPRQLVAPPELS